MSSHLRKASEADQPSRDIERLALLFRAFGSRDDASFQRIAESIITDHLVANRHAAAKELQLALGSPPPKPVTSTARPTGLRPLPRDRRNGDELITMLEPMKAIDRLVLNEVTEQGIVRVLDEHSHRLKLARYGYRPKSALLFWGPPGCGKTLTAHYLANQLRLPLGLVRLNAIISSFLGDTASHLQKIFDTAAETPMVLLLDEIDAIGKNRDDPNDVGELKRVVNSLLQAIDSYKPNEGLIIGASNHQYLLDPALWRRFDEVILFPLPGSKERDIFARRLLNGVHFTGSIAELVKKTSHMTYAALEQVLREAVKTAILADREVISVADVAEQMRAYKERLGAARKSANAMNDES